MSEVSIPAVDLVTTLRTAPMNGAPSSADYNDSLREILADLSTIALHLNDKIAPILSALPASAGAGIEGRTMYAAKETGNPLFYSEVGGRYLTVSEVFSAVNDRIRTQSTKVTDLAAQVASLRSRLATTNANDILTSIQGFSDQVRSLTERVNYVNAAAEVQAALLSNFRTARASSQVAAGESETVSLGWLVPFADSAWTVSVSVEDPENNIRMSGFSRHDVGTGVDVVIHNYGAASGTAVIHALARSDQQ